MKWLTRQSRETKKGKWHSWFAWYPVRVGQHTVWFEWIERFGDKQAGELFYYIYHYRLKTICLDCREE